MTDIHRPDNLYELCDEVCIAIEASPTNYYQPMWATPARGVYGKKACGTAFCRAGWMVALADGHAKAASGGVYKRALEMFTKAGISKAELQLLFQPDPGAYGRAYGDVVDKYVKEGTPEYVAIGAAGMRKFMAKWKKQLKEAKLDAC